MASQDVFPLTRRQSFDFLPPDLSELRVVLLGNCWIQRCLVESLLVGNDTFSSGTELQCSTKVSAPLGNQKIIVINTPDLLHPDLTDEELTLKIKEFADASEPGPHVLLLVLQPEDFSSQQQIWLQRALEMFSEHSFEHSMVLISTEESVMYTKTTPLGKMIRNCSYRYMWIKNFTEEEVEMKNFKRAELLSRLGQIAKEHKSSYLTFEAFEAPSAPPHIGEQKTTGSIMAGVLKAGLAVQDVTQRKISETRYGPTNLNFCILLFGKSDKKNNLSYFITGSKPNRRNIPKVECGEWRGHEVTVVKTADLFSMTVEQVREDIKTCVSLCPPGPNVLLLLVKPSEFTERNRQTLKFILSMFGPEAFKHSILIFTHHEQMTATVCQLVTDCELRFYEMHDQHVDILMNIIETVIQMNKGSFLTVTDSVFREMKTSFNLVVCGRKGAGKTCVTDAILGQRSSPQKNSSECIKHQRELHGLCLSIVEMPSLCDSSAQTAMELCFKSISLCDPEGVHAFLLVLPLNPLTDEDKAEFKILQDILGPRVGSFTMVLFTVESDASASAYTNFVSQNKDLKELIQSCGGRHLIFNIKDQQHVPQIIIKIKNITKDKNVPQSYTKEMFVQTQIEKMTAPTTETRLISGTTQRADSLRIVLIGKTGSGKSSSGNTILGREEFESDLSQTSVTKLCKKALTEVDGRRVEVVDTPGLFDSTMTNTEVNEEMLKCVSLLAPGPHIFLLVLQIGRFTPEERETLNLIRKAFGKGAEKFTMVLFTRGDDLKRFRLSLDDYIKLKCEASCQKLISDCGNRCHVFNNSEENAETQSAQVRDLIKKIDDVVRANGAGCYTSDMLQEAEAAIQKETERLLKEKEQELRREMEEMDRKHEKEMQEIKEKMEKQSKEMERERQERDRELKELEANIKKERSLRREEQNQREEESRKRKEQDRAIRQEYEWKLQELEVESKKSLDRKLQESKDQMEKDREAWEEERKQWWDNRQKQDETRQQEEHARLEKLEQEYRNKMETYRIKKEEEDQNRREQEEKQRRELQERHDRQVEELKRSYEEAARKKAEEFNDFKSKKEIDFAALIDKHLQEVCELKTEIQQGQEDYKSLQQLATHKETALKSEMVEQYDKHKNEMIDLAIVVLKEKKECSNKIREIQKQNQQELMTWKTEIQEKFTQKEKDEIKTLKTKQLQEMEDLKRGVKEEDLQQRQKELSTEHEEELRQLKSDLWSQQKQELQEKMGELEQKHVQGIKKFTENLLRKHEQEQNEKIRKLEEKHKQEIEKLKKKVGESTVEVEQMTMKHQQEINEIKLKMLPEEGRCPIS